MIYLVANKQDGATLRTAKDLELKYNFGQSFAEIYGLIDDTRTAAKEAVDELDNELDFEEIFNRLTNYGAVQTIYREDDNIYINASYIKSGTLAADLVDAANLEVNAAKIYGTLDAGDVTITNLSANSITGGTLDAGIVNIMNLSADSITSGTLNANCVTISNLSASNIISSGDITWSMLSSGVQSEIDNAYTMAKAHRIP